MSAALVWLDFLVFVGLAAYGAITLLTKYVIGPFMDRAERRAREQVERKYGAKQ